jgi:solute carrier family 45 protein 1/2/4
MVKDLEHGGDHYSSTASPIVKDGSLQQPGATTQGASFMRLVWVSIPRMSISMAWSAQWAAIGPYLSTMLPNYAVQLTQLIGPFVGILLGPMVGALSDNNTSRFGRRRPFLVVGSVLCIICWSLMSYTTQLGESLGDKPTDTTRKWTGLLTVIFYFWMDVMVTACQTPAMLLTADFAGDRQTLGSSIGLAWAALGSILVAVYIQIWGAAYLTLHYFMGMLCVVMAICTIVCCIAAKETPLDKSTVDGSKSTLAQAGQALVDIFLALKTLPADLISYAVIMFFTLFGYAAYNGNKAQFFGFEVFNGNPIGADSCGDACTEAQTAFSDGTALVTGTGDLLFCIVGYLYAMLLPFLVRKIGAKWVLVLSMVPQGLLAAIAFSTNRAWDIFVVAISTCSQSAVFGLMVPVVVHVFGGDPNVNIGKYIGSLNAANCFGQLLNYAVGSVLVQTSLGYKLPILVGGIVTLLGAVVGIFFVKIKMHSM